MAKRREFSRLVKAEIMKRCERPTGWQCEDCGIIVPNGEVDHTIAEALVVDKSKKLTARDGRFLCWPCHQGPDGKTPKDKAVIAKAKRQEYNRIGGKAAPAKPMQGRQFEPVDKPSKIARGGKIDKSQLIQIRYSAITGERLP